MQSKLKISLISLFIICVSNFHAQNSGYLGKKTFISADTRLFVPLLYNWTHVDESQKYKADGNSLNPARNLLSYGFNVTLGRAVDRKLAFLIQASVLNFKVSNESFYTPNNGSVIRSSFFHCRSLGIMPIIEITGTDGLSPIGLSHQIGLGFYQNKMVDKEYVVLANEYPDVVTYSKDNIDFFDFNNSVKSYSFMYKLNLRIPISRSLLYNFGIRYNLNFTALAFGLSDDKKGFLYSASETSEMIRYANRNNIISLETGLTLTF